MSAAIPSKMFCMRLDRNKTLITEQPDIDLTLLSDRFTECGDYTKGVILDELKIWQKTKDFLVLTSGDNGTIDGFLIGYRNRNSLWISQVFHKDETALATSMEAFNRAKKWAKERGMTSITGETTRKEFNAMKRFGFIEHSVLMKCEI